VWENLSLTAVMGLSLKYRPVIKAKSNNCCLLFDLLSINKFYLTIIQASLGVFPFYVLMES